MNRDEAIRIYESLESELGDVDRQAAYFAGRGTAIRKVMEGVRELFPDLLAPAPARPNLPINIQRRGRDYVRQVLATHGDRWFSPGEVLAELQATDARILGANPDTMVRRWLRTAEQQHMVERRQRDGRTLEYRWLNDDDPAEAGSSSLLEPLEEGGSHAAAVGE